MNNKDEELNTVKAKGKKRLGEQFSFKQMKATMTSRSDTKVQNSLNKTVDKLNAVPHTFPCY